MIQEILAPNIYLIHVPRNDSISIKITKTTLTYLNIYEIQNSDSKNYPHALKKKKRKKIVEL